MDKVNKVSELSGWRNAEDEELKVIQGILLEKAKSEIISSIIINGSLLIFSMVCFLGIKTLIQYIFIAIGRYDTKNVIILLGMIVFVLLILVGLVLNFIDSITKRTADTYYKAIKDNKFRVLDVQIENVISLKGIGNNGIDGHRVQVRDMQDVYCDENIVFICCNGYQKTRGILIEIPIRNGKSGKISRRCVIPCKEKDPRLWNIGMKNYDKL